MKKVLSENPFAFVVGEKDLEGRIDVNYYKPEYTEMVLKLRKGPFELKRLGDLVILSHERWRKPVSGTFRYVEINDIDIETAKIANAKEIDVLHAPSRAQMLIRKDDVIVSTTRPYRGAIALVTEEFDGCVCSTGFAVIRELKTGINRKYLLHFLHSDPGLKQFEQRMTGGNYPAISPDELLEIQIPYPNPDIQDSIVASIDEALQRKRTMEMKADDLLDSFNNSFLSELGIVLRKSEDQSPIEYGVGASCLKSNRWDVEYWKPKHIRMDKAIEAGKYSSSHFGSIIERIVNGLDYRDFSEEGTKYLRVGNIRPFGIDETGIEHIAVSLHDVTKGGILEKEDILLTRKGTYGVATLAESQDYIISSEIFRIKLTPDKQINAFYVVAILNSDIGRFQFSRKKVGTIMGSLSQEAVKQILIPIPPKAIQDKVAKEVKERIKEAGQLREEAKHELEERERWFERVIEGEEAYESGICGSH